jgi:predicted phosphodiesterase
MTKKELDLSEMADALAEGPVGKAKIEKQKEAIDQLQTALMMVLKRTRPYAIPVASTHNTIRFGVIGDTHIGSYYQRLDSLGLFYDRCYAEGVKEVLHSGDILAGWKVYKGQEFELHPHGRSWAEQSKMFAESVPVHEGMRTIFITGNHDNSFKKLTGMVVGDELGRLRSDWKFIGEDSGLVVLKTSSGKEYKVQLLHPGGGTAYAVSYHMQKTIEAMAVGPQPDLLCIGHYHKSLFMPAYRGICGLLSGCFESQTPFMLTHSLAAHVGGWIVTVVLGDREHHTTRIQTEWIGFGEA